MNLNNNQISAALTQLRQQAPLIVNLTNDVVMNLTANMLLAAGASPIMTQSRQEMAEMVSYASALVINIGTLDETRVARMRHAIDCANQAGKLIVLDPVGCGASRYRTQVSREFAALSNKLVIRANASELLALTGQNRRGQGVDSGDDAQSALNAARQWMEQQPQKALLEVVISGANDYVISADGSWQLSHGHPMMTRITGMGCSLTALVAAYRAVSPWGALTAVAALGIAAELSVAQANGPASLQMHLIDQLASLDEDTFSRQLRVQAL